MKTGQFKNTANKSSSTVYLDSITSSTGDDLDTYITNNINSLVSNDAIADDADISALQLQISANAAAITATNTEVATKFSKTSNNTVTSTANSFAGLLTASDLNATGNVIISGTDKTLQIDSATLSIGRATNTSNVNLRGVVTSTKPINYTADISTDPSFGTRTCIDKGYADGRFGQLTAANTWTTGQTFSGSNTTTFVAPLAASGGFFSAGGDKTTEITTNTSQFNSNTTNIGTGTGKTLNINSTNVNAANVINYTSNLSGSYTDRSLIDRGYLFNVSNIYNPSYQYPTVAAFADETITFTDGNGRFNITAPFLGSSSTSNSEGNYTGVYLNFGDNPVVNSITSTPLIRIAMLKLYYYVHYSAPIASNLYATNGSTATYTTTKTHSNVSGLGGIFCSFCDIIVIIRGNNDLFFYCPTQSPKTLYTNPTTAGAAGAPLAATSTYNSQTITFYPLQCLYVSNSRCRLVFGFPNQLNNPSASGRWISSYGYRVEIVASQTQKATTYANTLPSLLPSDAANNSMAGSAYFSLS